VGVLGLMLSECPQVKPNRGLTSIEIPCMMYTSQRGERHTMTQSYEYTDAEWDAIKRLEEEGDWASYKEIDLPEEAIAQIEGRIGQYLEGWYTDEEVTKGILVTIIRSRQKRSLNI